jgi:hypothetical protein
MGGTGQFTSSETLDHGYVPSSARLAPPGTTSRSPAEAPTLLGTLWPEKDAALVTSGGL